MRSFYAEGSVKTSEGETLSLVCDFYALDIIEQITGQDWDDIIPQLGPTCNRGLAVKVLYGFLRRKHDGITMDEAAAISYDENSLAIWTVVGDIIRRACNIADDELEGEPSKKKPDGRSQSSAKNG